MVLRSNSNVMVLLKILIQKNIFKSRILNFQYTLIGIENSILFFPIFQFETVINQKDSQMDTLSNDVFDLSIINVYKDFKKHYQTLQTQYENEKTLRQELTKKMDIYERLSNVYAKTNVF
ncbi:hypothetical protein BpHYR1_034441 [Brachionus plicatilis]|uniref:Uncharacterized protein n=1 Tax=Brachionus plicatilis TaxID=10195 RepID=A0A3M7QZ53_BRAPC|nr:hypothetical protein BpHYR1_034441 [Brachionus plicatilis]